MSRPVLPPERKRVRIQPLVAPESDKWLSDQPKSLGRTIDMLVQHYIDGLPDENHISTWFEAHEDGCYILGCDTKAMPSKVGLLKEEE